MSLRSIAFALLLLSPLGAAAGSPFTEIHPEEAYPDPTGTASPDAYTGFIKTVQEKLRELGFDGGPANGDFGPKTQTALGQFQLSRGIPASGQLDDATLAGLGVQREAAQASAGASADSAPEQEPEHGNEANPPTGG